METERILVIDDNPHVGSALSDLLSPLGYAVVSARGGAAGLSLARSGPPFSVVLVDPDLPQVYGLGVIARLAGEHPDLPLIALLGADEPGQALRAIREGAWDAIAQPLNDLGELTEALERVRARARSLTGRVRAGKTHHASELEAFHAISEAISHSLELEALLASALETLLSLTGLERGHVRLLTGEPPSLELCTAQGTREEFWQEARTVALGVCACGVAARRGEPIIIQDLEADPMMMREECLREGVRSMAVLPLMVGAEVLGTIQVASRTSRPFLAAEVRMLQTISRQIGVAIKNARLYEQARREIDDRRRAEEQSLHFTQRLRILRDIYQAILAAESPRAVAQAVLRGTRELVSYQWASVTLFDFSGSMTIRRIAVVTDMARGTSLGEQVIPAEHFHGLDLLRQGREHVVEDVKALPDPSPGEQKMIKRGIRSYVNVPLHVGGELIGSLNVESTQPGHFSPSTLEVLREVTGPLAVAIHQADLHEQIQRHAGDLEERVADRTKELSALYEVTAIAIESPNIQVTLEQSLRAILEHMNVRSGSIQVLNEGGTQLRLVAHRGLEELLSELDDVPARHGLPGIVIETSEPLVVPDLSVMPTASGAYATAGFQSYIGEPIRAGGDVAAVLSVLGHQTQRLTAEEIALLSAVADHIGMAIENARLRQTAERAAALEERERLAQDLHDSVTQSLYSLTLFARAAQELARQENWSLLRDRLADIRESSTQALREMRLLVHQLRPAALQQEGLAQALQKRLDAVEKRSGMDATFLVNGSADLPEAVELGLYLLALEALNNALKHASASKVAVTLSMAPEDIELVIEDDGTGFNPEAVGHKGGMGLANMEARVSKMQGDLSIRSSNEAGTRITIHVNPKLAFDAGPSQEI